MMSSRLATLCALCLAAFGLAADEVCVRDARDQSLCVSQPAQRLVSLSPGATELLFSAGAGEQLVAVSAWSDYPPQAAALPQVGDSNRLDLETIVALAPDLVVAWVDGNSRAQLQKLSAIGIKVFWLAPRSFEDIARAVEDLALLTGHAELGKRRAGDFRGGIRRLQSQFSGAPPIDVFYQIWDQPLMTINREELISKAITLCGGINVFGDLPRLVPRITIEAVVAAMRDGADITLMVDGDEQVRAAGRVAARMLGVAAAAPAMA